MEVTHQQQNTKDKEVFTKIKRKLLKKFGRAPIFKDKVIKIAKELSNNDKRFTKYINSIYDNKNKITYAEFVKKAVPKAGCSWKLNPDEAGYQTTQRIMPSGMRNKTINVFTRKVINDILHEFWDKKIERNFINDFMNSDVFDSGHFKDSASFVRFTNISDTWIHIDAIQTDFYNLIRKYGADKKIKGVQKKIISKILGTEMDSYKTAVSLIKKRHPKVKIWTMNTAAMARKAEHIESGEKLSSLYTELPPKLGFKLISIERLGKIIGTRPDKKTKEVSSDNKMFKYDFLKKISKIGKTSNKAIASEIKDTYERKEEEFKKKIKQYSLNLKSDFTVSRSNFQNGLFALMKVYYTSQTDQEKIIIKDTAHNVALRMQEYMFDEKRIDGLDNIIFREIILALQVLKKEAEIEKEDGGELSNTIWWGNRDMINEEASSILSMLRESI